MKSVKRPLKNKESKSLLQQRVGTIQLSLEKIRVKGEALLRRPQSSHFLIELKEWIMHHSAHAEKLRIQDEHFLDKECRENYLLLYFQDLFELANIAEAKGFSYEANWLFKIIEEQSGFFADRSPFYLGVGNLFARLYLTATIEDFLEQSTSELQEMVKQCSTDYYPILWHILYTDYIQQKTEFLVSQLERAEKEQADLKPQGIFYSLKQLKLSIPVLSLVK